METEYKQEAWSLEDLFPGLKTEEIQDAIHELDQRLDTFEANREKLAADLKTSDFMDILQDYEGISRLISRLNGFAYLSFSQDTQDQEAQAFQAQMDQLGAEAGNRTLFFTLWWKALEDEPAARLMEKAGDYRYFLEALRLHKPYTLSEPEEKVINLKDVNGPNALVTLYDSITNRYVYEMEIEGEVKKLTRGELSVYYRSSDPELRAQAYQKLHQKYDYDAPILGKIYQHRARDWGSENVSLRGFASPISVRNLDNDVPDESVEILLQVCQDNASLFHRYFALKARWLGLDKIRRYDIYAPVVTSDRTFSFPQAVDYVLTSFDQFQPSYAALARRVFRDRHLDSEVRPGKMDGAFCLTVTPDLTPWVLQNYQSKVEDISTMAHELGHAIHSMLAEDHTALTQHASLPLAETASTFSEMLLVDHLLEQDPDPEIRRDLLFRQVDDAYATILRQAYFAIFERQAHQMVNEGATVDEISEAYLENLRDQFGDSLGLSDDFKVEWLEIPHIYWYPFYVYAYTFGQLLVLSLYKQYLEEGESFKPKYIDILSAGGSDSPARILDRAGVDFQKAEFWQGGFDVVEGMIAQLEQIEIPDQ